jgi:hypothetical protein
MTDHHTPPMTWGQDHRFVRTDQRIIQTHRHPGV